MSESRLLHRFATHVDEIDRTRLLEMPESAEHRQELVTRENGSSVRLDALGSLHAEFSLRRSQWDDERPKSDRWLAPRFHSALRISRTVASDRQMWQWLALTRWSDYVLWRWSGDAVADNRWIGPVNKQALARLWWGGELFRNGPDYSSVEKAFLNQDLVNSYLHRPLVRCRSFALGIVDVLSEETAGKLTSDTVNDLARVLNLCTAGTPPEARVGFQADDRSAAVEWSQTDAPADTDWGTLPAGPSAADTTNQSVELGINLAAHGMELARRR